VASAAWSLLPSQDQLLDQQTHAYGQRMLNLPCWAFESSRTVSHLFGREDVLAEIDQHLLVPVNTEAMEHLRTVAICGFGGIDMSAES
jgi:hypothetical protein